MGQAIGEAAIAIALIFFAIAIVIVLTVAIIITGIILIILFNFGLVNSYHPMKKAKEGQIRVACVGDSITYGCKVRSRGKNCYPAVLRKLLGENYCVNNFGYTDRAAIKTADHPFVRERLYRKSLDFKPDIVFLLLGSNDSKERNWDREKFIADYSAIVDSYSALESAPKVYLLVPPPAFEVHGRVKYRLRKEIIENEIAPSVKEIAAAKALNLIDLDEAFAGKQELFSDGIHPNVKGCKLLAETVFGAMEG